MRACSWISERLRETDGRDTVLYKAHASERFVSLRKPEPGEERHGNKGMKRAMLADYSRLFIAVTPGHQRHACSAKHGCTNTHVVLSFGADGHLFGF